MSAPLPTGTTGLAVDMTTVDNTYGLYSYGRPAAITGPVLLVEGLTDDEEALIEGLTSQIISKRFPLELHDSYYRGLARIQDLGISIPPQMRSLHTALGWPRVCVDALDERLDVEGFRYPNSNDVDLDLQAIWQANDLDSESQLAHMDALTFGSAYVAVGSGGCGPNEVDCPPLITVESPLDLGIEWDARTRTVLSALRLYNFEGSHQGTLYTHEQTISLLRTANGWKVVDRDKHNLGVCPVVRMANRPRSYDRDGASEITPEIMSLTDAACRKLQGLEVASEFYSGPQKYILGADESAFQAPDGTPRTAWETYLGRVLALERDADGNVPTVGQFTAYDPSVYTKIIEMGGKLISMNTGMPPHYLGYATDNPTSADAIRSSESRLAKKADRKCRMFGTGWRDVMKLALLIRDGNLPTDARRIATVWGSTATPTIGATTDAIFKQVSMGYLPATSDVVGEKLGYTAIERERIEIDRATDQGMSFLQEAAHSLIGKAARVDKALTADIATANSPLPGAATPPAPAKPGG